MGRRYEIYDVTDPSGTRPTAPTPSGPSGPSSATRLTLAGLAGLISAAVAIGVSQLVAGFTGSPGAPVTAVGGSAIDLAPPAVKNFAISAFGSNDKVVLVAGILVLLAVFAVAIGVAASRRLAYGLAGLAVFAGIGLAAALTRPNAAPPDTLPTLAGAAAAAVALTYLVRAASPAPRPAGGAVSRPAPATAADGSTAPAPAPPGGGGTAAGQPDRRRFLITGSLALAAAGLGAVGGRAVSGSSRLVTKAQSSVRFPAPAHPAPALRGGADLHVPGLGPFLTPNSTFYRVDTALILPQVPPASWRLRIHGMVQREITLTYHELLHLPLTESYTTLTCVSNPVGGPYIGNARWLGASLASLLRRAGIRRGADQLLCTSTDGFTSGTPIQTVMDGRDALLALAMNGAALPVAHGYPVRMVVPGLYGYVSATKWITDIKVTTFAAEHAYWVDRGWSQQAPIKTESRIDVPGRGASLQPGRHSVAGVAWAQHKGIEAVEVRVDGGSWHQARLGAVPGIDTWRQWVWEWDAGSGSHRIEARATDATGYTQTAALTPPEPNGATGYPGIEVSVA